MGTLRKLFTGVKDFFKGKTKPNITKVNLDQTNINPKSGGSASGGSKGRATPKGVIHAYTNVSPVKSAYKCNRGFLTQNKRLYKNFV